MYKRDTFKVNTRKIHIKKWGNIQLMIIKASFTKLFSKVDFKLKQHY